MSRRVARRGLERLQGARHRCRLRAAPAGHLVNIIAGIDDSLDRLQPFSPLSWATADSPVTGTLPTTYLALVAACIVLTAGTATVFDHHDLS